MEVTQIPLDKLVWSDKNPRKDRNNDQPEKLGGSIIAKGIMVPLLVEANKDGTFGIVDGWRRKTAYEQAGLNGELPCIVEKLDISDGLAVNGHRVDMSLHDNIIAVRDMRGKDKSWQFIATKLGCTEKLAKQSLALSSLPDVILDMIRDGKIHQHGAITMMAENIPATIAFIEAKGEETWYVHELTDHLRNSGRVGLQDPQVRYLGREEVEANHGGIEEELFGDGGYVVDPAAVTRGAKKKLIASCEALEAEGWGRTHHFLKINDMPGDMVRLHGKENEAAREAYDDWLSKQEEDWEDSPELVDIADELEAAASEPIFTDEMKSVGLVLVAIGWGGNEHHEYVVDPQKWDEAIKLGIIKDDKPAPAEPKTEDAEPELWSNADLQRLWVIDQLCGRNAVLTGKGMWKDILASHWSSQYGNGLTMGLAHAQPLIADDSYLTEVEVLKPEIAGHTFEQAKALSSADKDAILKVIVANAIPASMKMVNCRPVRSELIAWINPNHRKWWTPGPLWLKTLRKPVLIEIGAELGLGQNTIDWGKASKGDMTALLNEAFSGEPGAHWNGRLDDAVKAAKTWLPEPLRTED